MSDLEGPLEQLEQGLQLVIDRTGARWQKPGRTHLFFEVEKDRAEALYSELSDRFETRSQNGRRILTPEPVPEPDADASHQASLYRRWHTMEEVAELCDIHPRTAYRKIVEPENDLLVRTICGQGQPRVVRTSLDLASYLAVTFGTELAIDIDPAIEPRQPIVETFELSEPAYTIRELASALQRSVHSVRYMSQQFADRLPVTKTWSDESNQHVKTLVSGPILASVMADYWDMTVTIAAGLRREVAA